MTVAVELMEPEFISKLKFNADGLIPAVVQEAATGRVLMLAYMNRESIEKTLETGRTWFFSRSRQELWQKGETSGNFQAVRGIYYDCDADTLLVRVDQTGYACHTGAYSCFFNKAAGGEDTEEGLVEALYNLISRRFEERPEGSYTSYLFNEGQDKILKKVGEETAEVIIGSKNNDLDELRYELGDLMYHCLVLMVFHGIKPTEILEELNKRRR